MQPEFYIMKTIAQILEFLQGNPPASEIELNTVLFVCRQQLHYYLPAAFNSLKPSPDGIKGLEFAQWVAHGFAAGEWVDWNGAEYLISRSTPSTVHFCGYFSKGKFSVCSEDTNTISPLKLSDERNAELSRLLANEGLELISGGVLTKKYLPSELSKVYAISGDVAIIGICSQVKANEIELICSYNYGNKKCLYSEKLALPIDTWRFREATIGEFRRLNRELEACGKIWNDRMKRIEPLHAKAKKGESYWYIDDKMNVVCKKEKECPTSHQRYLAGNYFLSQSDCLEVLGQFNLILQKKLRE